MQAETAPSRWIFIRGLVRESAHWDDFPERFVAGIPGTTVDLVDLPGNGRHCRIASPLSLNAAMEFARGEWQQRTVGRSDGFEPVLLFSISLGSMVAIEWMDRHPEEIAGSVLINTSLRRLSPFHQRLNWRAWPEMIRVALQRDVAARERGILELTSALRTRREIDALVQSRVEIHREHPVDAANVVRQLVAAARYSPPSVKPLVPVLLLSSRGDRLADPGCTDALAAQWGLVPRIHPAAGHDLPLDDPDWTIRMVRDWLSEWRQTGTS
jgi:pimeloyl-ACP methyl ester carboxylesterase